LKSLASTDAIDFGEEEEGKLGKASGKTENLNLLNQSTGDISIESEASSATQMRRRKEPRDGSRRNYTSGTGTGIGIGMSSGSRSFSQDSHMNQTRNSDKGGKSATASGKYFAPISASGGSSARGKASNTTTITSSRNSHTRSHQKRPVTQTRHRGFTYTYNDNELSAAPSYSMSISPPSSSSSAGIPTISDFMPADGQYKHFRREFSTSAGGSGSGSANRRKMYHAHSPSKPAHLQLANFCTIFSIIALILLTMFGIMIENEPLYIKGISVERTPMVRNLHGEYTEYSWVHFSSRLQMLNQYKYKMGNNNINRDVNSSGDVVNDTEAELEVPAYAHAQSDQDDGNTNPEDNTSEKERNYRKLSNMNMEYELKSEAKVAFKAAALYFLCAVLSYIYVQNHVLIWQKYRAFAGYGHTHRGEYHDYGQPGFVHRRGTTGGALAGTGIFGRIMCILGGVGRSINKCITHYRRRNYRNVQEVNGDSSSSGIGIGDGSAGSAKARMSRSVDVLLNQKHRNSRLNKSQMRQGRSTTNSNIRPEIMADGSLNSSARHGARGQEGTDMDHDQDQGLSMREWEMRRGGVGGSGQNETVGIGSVPTRSDSSDDNLLSGGGAGGWSGMLTNKSKKR